jgi:hypothetical protein
MFSSVETSFLDKAVNLGIVVRIVNLNTLSMAIPTYYIANRISNIPADSRNEHHNLVIIRSSTHYL